VQGDAQKTCADRPGLIYYKLVRTGRTNIPSAATSLQLADFIAKVPKDAAGIFPPKKRNNWQHFPLALEKTKAVNARA
jgi:hypothetical protein